MLSRADILALAYAAVTAGGVAFLGLNALTLLVPTVVFLGVFVDGIARPGASLLYPTISRGPGKARQVALTFDDGPDPEVTPAVLDTLARHGARATFFGIGRSIEANTALAQRTLREGHELGNHSWQHSRWQNFFGVRRQSQEIERGAAAIVAATGGSPPALYRPPMGLKSPPFARAAWTRGLRVIAWSINSRDTMISSPERVARRVLNRIRSGDIVLMHDGHDLPGHHRPGCPAALALILEGLRRKQLQCVTVSELLANK